MNDETLRGILASAGVRGPNLDSCCAVCGLSPPVALLAAIRAKSTARRNPAGLLVKELLNGFKPPSLLSPAEVSLIARTGNVRAIAGHKLDPQSPVMNHGDKYVTFVDEKGEPCRVELDALTPAAIEVSPSNGVKK